MTGLFSHVISSVDASGHDDLYAQRRIPEIEVLATYGGIHIEDRLEALLIETDVRDLISLDEWPRSEGFEVIPRPIPGRDGVVRICVQLLDARFRDVFRVLAEDVCEVLSGLSDPAEAVRQIYRRIFRWQEFLRKHRPNGLSEEARAGLFGELHVLQSEFLPQLSQEDCVSAWRGCRKAHQDFQFTGVALEVKSTRAVVPDVVYISNLQQLDDEHMEHLFLTIVSLHENESEGETLAETVEALRARLADPALALFNEGLLELGYLDVHAPQYRRTRYQVRNVMHFRVGEGFPRLLQQQMPPGVRGVKYQIGLDACRPFRCDSSDVISTIVTRQDGGRYE